MSPTDGVRRRIVEPDATLDPLTLAVVRDDHLHVTNGTAEDAYITRLMAASLRAAERFTRRSLLTQRWTLTLCGFPAGGVIVLPLPPTQSVVSIAYVDEDGVTQTWGSGSPLPYDVLLPSGPQAGYATIRPTYDETWPTVRRQADAVVVTFDAGYPEVGSPPTCDLPEDLNQGRLLLIGELYKQRSESVHAFNQNPALVRARDLWMGYRVF